jgi:hypothetical protein
MHTAEANHDRKDHEKGTRDRMTPHAAIIASGVPVKGAGIARFTKIAAFG